MWQIFCIFSYSAWQLVYCKCDNHVDIVLCASSKIFFFSRKLFGFALLRFRQSTFCLYLFTAQGYKAVLLIFTQALYKNTCKTTPADNVLSVINIEPTRPMGMWCLSWKKISCSSENNRVTNSITPANGSNLSWKFVCSCRNFFSR